MHCCSRQQKRSGYKFWAPHKEADKTMLETPALHKICALAVMPPAQGGIHALGTVLISSVVPSSRAATEQDCGRF